MIDIAHRRILARDISPPRAILVAALVLTGAAAIGCYNPKVAPGGFLCAPMGQKQCPDGLICVGGTCEDPLVSGGGRAGTGGVAGNGGRGGGAGGMAGGGGSGATCANPIAPLCQPNPPAPTPCDPVCRTGCPCGMRCNVTVTSAGVTGSGCFPVGGTRTLGQVCHLSADDCLPGLTCLKEPCGTNLGRCYRFCRDGSECGDSSVCGTLVQLEGGGGTSAFKVCNVGNQAPACDPYMRSGCPDQALVCYAIAAITKCDCPGPANAQEGEACVFPNDCGVGLTCLRTPSATTCHRICKTSADCAGGAVCTISGPAGYCP